MLKSVYSDSQNSEGSAQEENEKYMDSIEGRIAKVKNELQELSSTVLNSTLIKGVLSALTSVLDVINKILNSAAALPITFGLIWKAISFGKKQIFGEEILNSVEKLKKELSNTGLEEAVQKMTSAGVDDSKMRQVLNQQGYDASDIDTTMKNAKEAASEEALANAKRDAAAAEAEKTASKESGVGASAAAEAANKKEEMSERTLAESEKEEAGSEALQSEANVTGSSTSAAKSGASEVEVATTADLAIQEWEEAAAENATTEADLLGAEASDVKSVSNTGEALSEDGKKSYKKGGLINILSGLKTGVVNDVVGLGEAVKGSGVFTSLTESMTGSSVGAVSSMGTALSGLSAGAIGAATAIAGLGAAVVAGKLIWDQYQASTEQTSKRVDELMESYNDKVSEAKKIQELNTSSGSRYEELSKGINAAGENIGLTNDEYEEYKNIVNQIADLCPSLVSGFNSQGDAILSLKGNAEGLTDAYTQARDAADNLLLGNGGEEDGDPEDIFDNFKNMNKSSAWDNLLDFGADDAGKGVSYADAIKELKAVSNMTASQFRNADKVTDSGTRKQISKLSKMENEVGRSSYIYKNLDIDQNSTDEEFAAAQEKARGLITTYQAKVDEAVKNVTAYGAAAMRQSDGYKKLTDANAQSVLTQSIQNMSADDLKNNKIEESSDMIAYAQNISSKVANNDSAVNTLKEVSSKTVDDFGGDVQKYVDYMDEIQEKFTKNGEYGVDIPLNFLVEDQKSIVEKLDKSINSITSDSSQIETLRKYMSDNDIITEDDIAKWEEYTQNAKSAAEAIAMYESAVAKAQDTSSKADLAVYNAKQGIEDKKENAQKTGTETYEDGNVNRYKAPTIMWTDENIKKYKSQMKSYGIDTSKYEGKDKSTTLMSVQRDFDNTTKEQKKNDSKGYSGKIVFTPVFKDEEGKTQVLNSKQLSQYTKAITKKSADNEDVKNADKSGAYVNTYDKQGNVIGKQFVSGLVETVASASPEMVDAVQKAFSGTSGKTIKDVTKNFRESIKDLYDFDSMGLEDSDINKTIDGVIEKMGDTSSLEAFKNSIDDNMKEILDSADASIQLLQAKFDSKNIYGDYEDAQWAKYYQKQADTVAKSLDDLWDSDSFKDARSDLESLASTTGITATDIDNLASSNSSLQEILDQTGMSASYVAECFNKMSLNGSSASDLITSDALRVNEVLTVMKDKLDAADSAYTKYKNSIDNGDEYNDQLTNYETAYTSLGEMFDKGTYGKDFYRTIEFLMGQKDNQGNANATKTPEQLEKQYKAMKPLYSTIKDEDGNSTSQNGYGLIEDFYKNQAEIKEKYNLSDKTKVTLDAEGYYNTNIEDDDISKIAKYYNTTTEGITSVVHAMGMLGGYTDYSPEKLIQTFQKLDMAQSTFGDKTALSVQGVRDLLESLGLENFEIEQILDTLKKSDDLKLFDFDTKNEDTLNKQLENLKKLKDSDGNASIKVDKSGNIDLKSWITQLRDMGMSWDDVRSATEKYYTVLDKAGNSFTDTAGETIDTQKQVIASIDASEKANSITVLSSALQELKDDAKDAVSWLNKANGTDVSFNFDAADLDTAKTQLDNFHDTYKDYLTETEDGDWTINPDCDKEGVDKVKTLLKGLIAQKQALEQPTIMKIAAANVTNEDKQTEVSTLQNIVSTSQTIYAKGKAGENTEDLKTQLKKQLQEVQEEFGKDENSITVKAGIKGDETADEFLEKITALNQGDLVNLGINTNAFTDGADSIKSAADSLNEVFSGKKNFKMSLGFEDGQLTLTGGFEEDESKDDTSSSKNNSKSNDTTSSESNSNVNDTVKHKTSTNSEKRAENQKNAFGQWGYGVNAYNQIATGKTLETLPVTAKVMLDLTDAEGVEKEWTTEELIKKGVLDSDNTKAFAKDTVWSASTLIKSGILTADTSKALGIEDAWKKAKKTKTNKVNASTKAAEKKESSFLKKKKSKTITVSAIINATLNGAKAAISAVKKFFNFASGTANATGTAHAFGTAFATGTAKADGDWSTHEGGTALMGEVGREAIVRNGKYFTVGDSGAEMVRYKKGDIIFNNSQTEQLLSKGKITSGVKRGKVYGGGSNSSYGYARGTAFADGSVDEAADKKLFDTVNNITPSDRASAKKAKATGSAFANGTVDDIDLFGLEGDYGDEEDDFAYAKGSAFAEGRAFATSKVKKKKASSSSSKKSSSSSSSKSKSGSGSSGSSNKNKSGNSNSKSTTTKKTALEKFQDWFKQFFDWIEVKLTRLETKTKKYYTAAEQAMDEAQRYGKSSLYSTAKTNYKSAISSTKDEITANQQGASRYQGFANTVMKQAVSRGLVSSKTAKSIKDKVANGTINISGYSEKTQEVIKSYQEWAEKAIACKDAQSDLNIQLKEYYDALYNVPIQKAIDSVNKLSEALDKLDKKSSIAEKGGIQAYYTRAVSEAKSTYTSARSKVGKSSTLYKNMTSAKSTYNKKSSKVSKLKSNLGKTLKSKIGADGYINTTGLSKSQKKKANKYNKAVKAQYSAATKSNNAKGSYNSAVKQSNAALKEYQAILKESNTYGNDRVYYKDANQILDAEDKNIKSQTSVNKAALKEANASVSYNQARKESAKNTATSQSKKILSKYSKKLTKSQKAALKAGKTVSTKGVTNKKELAALNWYNQCLKNAADYTKKYNAAKAAATTASETYNDSLLTETETIQENAKARVDNVEAYYDAIKKLQDAKVSTSESNITLKKNLGQQVTASDYSSIQSLQSTNLSNAEQEYKDYLSVYNANQSKMNAEDKKTAQATLETLKQNINTAKSEIQETTDTLNALIITGIQNYIDDLKTAADQIQNALDINEAKGLATTSKEYSKLIANSQEQVSQLEKENAEYKRQQQGLSVSSDKYRELQEKIDDNLSSISSAQKNQIEWNQSIDNMDITKFQNLNDLIGQLNDKLQNFVSLAEAHGNKGSDNLLLEQILNAQKTIENDRKQLELIEANVRKYAGKSGNWGLDLSDKQLETFMTLFKNEDALGLQAFLEGLGKSYEQMTGLQDAIKNWGDTSNDVYSNMIEQEGLYDDLIDKRISVLDELSNKLSKINDVQDRALTLEKAKYDLEKAKNNLTQKVWNGRAWVYTSDAQAVKEAQQSYDDAQFNELLNKIDDIKDVLEELKDNNNLYTDDGLTQEALDAIQKALQDIDTGDLADIFNIIKTQYANNNVDWDKIWKNFVGTTVPAEGYATGGVIPGSDHGDNTLIKVSSKERVLTPVQNAAFEKLAYDIMPDLVSSYQKIPDMASLLSGTSSNFGGSQSINQTFNITMPNVTDSTKASELMKDLESLSSKKIQRYN